MKKKVKRKIIILFLRFFFYSSYAVFVFFPRKKYNKSDSKERLEGKFVILVSVSSFVFLSFVFFKKGSLNNNSWEWVLVIVFSSFVLI